MGFFSRRKKDDFQGVFKKIQGKSIKYAASRDENSNESLLGKNGRINVLEDYIVIVCDGKEVFRWEGASASELMSLGGVIISGEDDTGNPIKAVAYYTYYR